MIARDDVVRKFWAGFLGSKVAKDGQVSGFSQWWEQAQPWQRSQAQRYAEACWTKIDQDRREPDECIAAGIAAFKYRLEHGRDPNGTVSREPIAMPKSEADWEMV